MMITALILLGVTALARPLIMPAPRSRHRRAWWM